MVVCWTHSLLAGSQSFFHHGWAFFPKSCQYHYFILLIIFFLLPLGGTSVLITLFPLEFWRFLLLSKNLIVNSINLYCLRKSSLFLSFLLPLWIPKTTGYRGKVLNQQDVTMLQKKFWVWALDWISWKILFFIQETKITASLAITWRFTCLYSLLNNFLIIATAAWYHTWPIFMKEYTYVLW